MLAIRKTAGMPLPRLNIGNSPYFTDHDAVKLAKEVAVLGWDNARWPGQLKSDPEEDTSSKGPDHADVDMNDGTQV
ncbi:hypothetical protein EUX98_g8435 [Antrodiella citrinella]|uniref:Uncharacterized protein n=1 Tax=Antrodiella citrinella TaxID=2447956 RepID=A0A4S4MDP7_9APHY|nr:hypothetical protein EUX98_g8435 [Antrodiella citrinella]